MNEIMGFAATAVMGFLAIMNPLANTPVFLGLTANDDTETRKAIARRSLLLAFVIIALFTIAGNYIFELFGITLYAFRVTGGILVFVIGYGMLHGKTSGVHGANELESNPPASSGTESKLSIAVSPLAIPIFAGPGTIATAMNFTADRELIHIATTLGAFATICFISYGFMIFGERLIRYLGDSAVSAVTKMMGMILAVIGVQMFIAGVAAAISHFR